MMKRDFSTIPQTYVPPRVRVVEVFSEQGILSGSTKNFESAFSVDELENVNADGDEDKFYFEF